MKRNTWIVQFIFVCTVCCIGTSCVSSYQPLELEGMAVDEYKTSIRGANIQIALNYDVLTGPSNRRYAKRERKNRVNLIVLDFQNAGREELSLYSDLVFKTTAGDTIFPLSFEEAMRVLVDPVVNKGNTNDVVVEVPFV